MKFVYTNSPPNIINIIGKYYDNVSIIDDNPFVTLLVTLVIPVPILLAVLDTEPTNYYALYPND